MTNNTNLLNEMASNDLVRVKESGVPGVVACNFTRKAFYKGAWDEQTIRARGLFLDKNTGAVVARGYDKFFNVGQDGGPASIRDLAEAAVEAAPTSDNPHVALRHKLNGFLAIVSCINGNLTVLSKSGVTAYSMEAERILRAQIGDAGCERLRRILADNNMSATFECVSKRDPHMVHYRDEKMVFLDFIINDSDYTPVPFDAAFTTIRTVDPLMPVAPSTTLTYGWNWETADELEYLIQRNARNASRDHTEGYVVTYGDGRMAKIKSDWYVRAKRLRPVVKNAILRGDMEPMRRETEEITKMRTILADGGILDREWAQSAGLIIQDVTGAPTLDYPEWLYFAGPLLNACGYWDGLIVGN